MQNTNKHGGNKSASEKSFGRYLNVFRRLQMHGILLDGQRSALPGTGYEFHILVGDRITKLLILTKLLTALSGN